MREEIAMMEKRGVISPEDTPQLRVPTADAAGEPSMPKCAAEAADLLEDNPLTRAIEAVRAVVNNVIENRPRSSDR